MRPSSIIDGCLIDDFLKSKFNNRGSKKPLRIDFLKILFDSEIFKRKIKVVKTCL